MKHWYEATWKADNCIGSITFESELESDSPDLFDDAWLNSPELDHIEGFEWDEIHELHGVSV